jgi:hypothetical protein
MKFGRVLSLLLLLGIPGTLAAQTLQSNAQQGNTGAGAQQAADDAERTARRFRAGVEGGVGLDPQILHVGAFATFGPIFRPTIQFRPGIELGGGEITTVFGINLNVLYTIPGVSRDARWTPYVGAGPTFGLSHRGFETDEGEHVDVDGDSDDDNDRSRFDFSDTDFNAGMNFIVGMRRQNNLFFEMRATAWGVSNVKLLVGTSF